MSASLIIALLGVGGLGAIAAAIVTGLFSRRKLGAEATKIITDAAAGVVTSLEREIVRQRERMEIMIDEHRAAIRTLMANHAEEIEENRRALQMHTAWDYLAIDRLREHGVDLPPPPPLLPARRFPAADVQVD